MSFIISVLIMLSVLFVGILSYYIFRKIYINFEQKRVNNMPEAIPFQYGFDTKVENADEIYETLVNFKREINQQKKEGNL